MEKLPVSLCVITHNSDGRLRKLIERSRAFVSEVCVVDQSSTDGTEKDAKELSDVFVSKTKKGASDPDRNWLFSLANNPWVLYLDDDEYLSDELIKALPRLLKDNIDIYWLKTRNLVDGVNIEKILGDDYHPRLFKKGALGYVDQETNVDHTYPRVNGNPNVAFVDFHIVHDRTLSKVINSNRARNKVATQQQVQMQENFIKQVESLLEAENGKK